MLNWMTNARGEHFLYEINRDDFARQGGHELFARRFMSNLLEDDHFYLVVGTDSGLLLEYVARQLAPEAKARYIFVEDGEVLEALRSRHALAEHEAIQVCTVEELDGCRPQAKFNEFCYRSRVRMVMSLAAESDYSGLYAAIVEAATVSQTINRHQVHVSLGSKAFLQQHILDAPDHLHSGLEARGRFEDRRVLILAAGPSLDDVIEWVKAHRQSFVIIAVARIGAFLKTHGIVPDFYAIIDPHPVMLNVARDAVLQSAKVPLLAGYHSNTDVVANWGARVYFCGDRLPWGTELNIESFGVAGPTVTHFALSVAIRSGAKEIYLAGMDLCFGVNGLKSHCSENGESKAGPALGRNGVQQVRTYAGDVADADVNLLMSVDGASVLGKLATANGIPVFNLSANAAEVEGIAYRSPQEVDLDGELAEPFPDDGDVSVHQERYTEYLLALNAEFDKLRSDLRRLRANLKRRQRRIPELFEKEDGPIRPKIAKQVDGIDKQVERLGRGLEYFLKHWGGGYFMAHYEDKLEEEITPEDLSLYYTNYYDAYLKSIAEVIEVVTLASKKCDRRLLELSSEDLGELKAEWLKAREFLRIDKDILRPRLEKLDGYVRLSDELHEGFRNWYEVLAQADKLRCQQGVNQRNVVSKAYYLFDRKRVEALRDLNEFVKASDNDNLSPELASLLGGLLSELEMRGDEALQCFEAVINGTDRSLYEVALLQILEIAKRRADYPLCLYVFNCLDEISRTYLKYHAEMLIHVGDVKAALEKLADYHETFPEDLDNLVRIVDIYHLTGNTKQAREILDVVAEAHPEHVGVKRMVQTLAA